MSYLFIGGEDIDFSGNAEVNTGTAYRRSAFSRCALKTSAGTDSTIARGELSQPSSRFWFTARVYYNDHTSTTPTLTFYDGTQARLGITQHSISQFGLSQYTTAWTSLAVSSAIGAYTQKVGKIDVYIDYAAAGTVRVFWDGSEILTHTGDLLSGGSTSLTAFTLRGINYSHCYWSEVIVATTDTRALALVTHAPTAAGSSSQWTGTYANVDEAALSDADLISTTTPEQVASFQVSDLPATNIGVQAVVVKARAQRDSGGTGPTNLQLGVGSGGTLGFSPDIATPAGFTTVSAIFETNPVTGAPFTVAEANAMEIAVKSRT